MKKITRKLQKGLTLLEVGLAVFALAAVFAALTGSFSQKAREQKLALDGEYLNGLATLARQFMVDNEAAIKTYLGRGVGGCMVSVQDTSLPSFTCLGRTTTLSSGGFFPNNPVQLSPMGQRYVVYFMQDSNENVMGFLLDLTNDLDPSAPATNNLTPYELDSITKAAGTVGGVYNPDTRRYEGFGGSWSILESDLFPSSSWLAPHAPFFRQHPVAYINLAPTELTPDPSIPLSPTASDFVVRNDGGNPISRQMESDIYMFMPGGNHHSIQRASEVNGQTVTVDQIAKEQSSTTNISVLSHITLANHNIQGVQNTQAINAYVNEFPTNSGYCVLVMAESHGPCIDIDYNLSSVPHGYWGLQFGRTISEQITINNINSTSMPFDSLVDSGGKNINGVILGVGHLEVNGLSTRNYGQDIFFGVDKLNFHGQNINNTRGLRGVPATPSTLKVSGVEFAGNSVTIYGMYPAGDTATFNASSLTWDSVQGVPGEATLEIPSITSSQYPGNSGVLNAYVNISCAACTAPSDRRLKTQLTPLKGALQKLDTLTGYRFTWRKTNEKSVGVIAQEVEKVYPSLVSHNKDGYLAVNYQGLVAPVIEAIKTLANALAHLEARTKVLVQNTHHNLVLQRENNEMILKIRAQNKAIKARVMQTHNNNNKK